MKFSKLLFELGSIQVFSYYPIEDLSKQVDELEHKQIYWQDTVSKHTFGPFESIHACMVHYTTIIANQKKHIIGNKVIAPVIYVDFKAKARVVYEG